MIQRILLSYPYAQLVQASKGGKFSMTVDGKQVELEVNKHFVLPF